MVRRLSGQVMFLSVATPHAPATGPGDLLHKNPARYQQAALGDDGGRRRRWFPRRAIRSMT
ncbi:MAG: hypothetical protein KTR19_05580 [Hyphomicrobiales bacterium]|nr:hypothetical protein [Hyphomicrobiales bacterium]